MVYNMFPFHPHPPPKALSIHFFLLMVSKAEGLYQLQSLVHPKPSSSLLTAVHAVQFTHFVEQVALHQGRGTV